MKLEPGHKSLSGIRNLITVSIAIFIAFSLLICPIATGNDGGGLIDKVSGKAETLIYFKEIKKGLRPFLKSDFYGKAEDLSLFEGPIRTDVSAPAISFLGDMEKSLGFSVTPKRILHLIGKDAVIYKTRAAGGRATVGIFEIGWLKRLLVKTVSNLKSSITEENIDGLLVFKTNAGSRKIYYTITASHFLFSDSPLALKAQHDTLTNVKGDTLKDNPDFIKGLAAMPTEYHVLIYRKITEPQPYETGLIKRGERLIGEVDYIFTSVTFTKEGAEVTLYAPLKSGYAESVFSGIGNVGKRPAPEIDSLPSETAGFIAFNSYDPEILYTNFLNNWFSGVFERVNYVSTLRKWKTEAGFDVEGGIINNLTGGALLAVTGIGYEGRMPYVKGFQCLGVKDGGGAVLSENLSSLFDYAFWDDGPSSLEYNGASLHYMGMLREKNTEWSGSNYIRTVEANPGFGIKENRLYLYRDISTIERILNAQILAGIDASSGKGLFSGDFLVNSGPFIDAQKDLPVGEHDLYIYLSGENTATTIEKYLINLNVHYRYFLYEDAEKRFVPLLELTRESFVSFYGGVNFEGDAVKGSFRLVAKDFD